VGTICDESCPTTLLTLLGRDREQGRIELPFLVQRHCRDTARTVGLHDRGVLAPGLKADVNVIERLVARRPEVRYDLPAGGRGCCSGRMATPTPSSAASRSTPTARRPASCRGGWSGALSPRRRSVR
jgi:N-acyl-D-aspartate/D-glutamate deacylase